MFTKRNLSLLDSSNSLCRCLSFQIFFSSSLEKEKAAAYWVNCSGSTPLCSSQSTAQGLYLNPFFSSNPESMHIILWPSPVLQTRRHGGDFSPRIIPSPLPCINNNEGDGDDAAALCFSSTIHQRISERGTHLTRL